MQIDFTVPVIDNFGDMGFALSLARSMLARDASLSIRFYSEDAALFQKMLGSACPERLVYAPLNSWATSERGPIRCNFFGYRINEAELVNERYPEIILNFDYLQFHADHGP